MVHRPSWKRSQHKSFKDVWGYGERQENFHLYKTRPERVWHQSGLTIDLGPTWHINPHILSQIRASLRPDQGQIFHHQHFIHWALMAWLHNALCRLEDIAWLMQPYHRGVSGEVLGLITVGVWVAGAVITLVATRGPSPSRQKGHNRTHPVVLA